MDTPNFLLNKDSSMKELLKDLVWSKNTKEFAHLEIADWLLDEGSLTAKLKQQYPDFKVELLSQIQATPYDNEIELLSDNEIYTIREVILWGNNTKQVYARSVIPKVQSLNFLRALGNKPLGEVLFTHPDIQRHQMQFSRYNQHWGRRSIFGLSGVELMVSEFFLF